MHENNANKFSKCDPCHQRKQEPQNVAQHILTLLKSFVQHVFASINGFSDMYFNGQF